MENPTGKNMEANNAATATVWQVEDLRSSTAPGEKNRFAIISCPFWI
jgi:hypothetical protein